MLDRVIRGINTQADVYFYKDGSNPPAPLVVTGGVTYQITTPENLLVDSGVAEQDIDNAARWIIHFTIPKSAPTTGADEKYLLKWRARSVDEITSSQEYFTVDDPALLDPIDNSSVVLLNTPFNVNLITPRDDLVSLSLRILDQANNPIITLTNLIETVDEDDVTIPASPPGPIEPIVMGPNFVYSVPINSNTGLDAIHQRMNDTLFTYWAYFNYTVEGSTEQFTELQPIYIASPIMIDLMNSLRQVVDMLRNSDAVIQLQVTEAKLLHFVVQGMQMVNAMPPINFPFDFTMLSRASGFIYWVLKCAEYELLQALYLAEGMSAFDFQGMTVQLNSDRTQYIQSVISQIKSDIDQTLPKVKSQYARPGGLGGKVGHIGVVRGPASNFVYRAGWYRGGPSYGSPILPFLY